VKTSAASNMAPTVKFKSVTSIFISGWGVAPEPPNGDISFRLDGNQRAVYSTEARPHQELIVTTDECASFQTQASPSHLLSCLAQEGYRKRLFAVY
jgi:hypothetical protein